MLLTDDSRLSHEEYLSWPQNQNYISCEDMWTMKLSNQDIQTFPITSLVSNIWNHVQGHCNKVLKIEILLISLKTFKLQFKGIKQYLSIPGYKYSIQSPDRIILKKACIANHNNQRSRHITSNIFSSLHITIWPCNNVHYHVLSYEQDINFFNRPTECTEIVPTVTAQTTSTNHEFTVLYACPNESLERYKAAVY